jgi:hypothetical protein
MPSILPLPILEAARSGPGSFAAIPFSQYQQPSTNPIYAMNIRRISQLCAIAALVIPVASLPGQEKASTKPGKAPQAGTTNPKATAGKAAYDAILKKYVVNGHFGYAALLANPADLASFREFMKWQATADVKAMSREAQIAFYIDAYNSCCIQAILDHYPVHSPNDVPGFFDKLKFKVGGEEMSISAIEYDRLIANYLDMRAHFAVVCADRGCQPLKPSAWTAESLEADLEAAAKQFVGNKKYFFVDKEKREVHISKIFEWYGEKFTKDPKRPAAKPELFLLPWLTGDAKELLESGKYTVKIIEWDWTLNETAPRKKSAN